MVCQKCKGLMVKEWRPEFSQEAAVFRCINCGLVIDPLIAQNRVTHGIRRRDDADAWGRRRRNFPRLPPHHECPAVDASALFADRTNVIRPPQMLLRPKTHPITPPSAACGPSRGGP